MRPVSPVGIGVAGCGDISARYIRDLQRFPAVKVMACSSRSGESARRQAEAFGIEATTTDALLRRPEVQIVVNLTPPLQHAAVTEQALRAGKHVYSEKPLAASADSARSLIALAARNDQMLACAPATALGPAQQTTRALIDANALGEVVGASASIVYSGPDLWHAAPAALFAAGAGPLFDVGVYAVNGLVYLLGPVLAVSAMSRTMRPERTVRAGSRAGEVFPVERPTHVSALLRFEGGPVASLTCSFDAPGSRAPGLEVFGTEATLAGPGPSLFEGALQISRKLGEWSTVAPRIEGWTERLWPIGVLDMIAALSKRRLPRCDNAVALHVLDTMSAIEDAAASGESRPVHSTCERPPALAEDAYRQFEEVSP